MALLASAPWALLQQIGLFLNIAALPKKLKQVRLCKMIMTVALLFLGSLSTATTNRFFVIVVALPKGPWQARVCKM
jgi:hypothetical protein